MTVQGIPMEPLELAIEPDARLVLDGAAPPQRVWELIEPRVRDDGSELEPIDHRQWIR
jgi:hypothetical protein